MSARAFIITTAGQGNIPLAVLRGRDGFFWDYTNNVFTQTPAGPTQNAPELTIGTTGTGIYFLNITNTPIAQWLDGSYPVVQMSGNNTASGAVAVINMTAGDDQNSFISLNSGQVVSATGNTLVLASTSSTQDSSYVGALAFIVSGPGAGQIGSITGYTGATHTAAINVNGGPWVVIPNTSNTYAILPQGPVSASVSGAVNVGSWNGTPVQSFPPNFFQLAVTNTGLVTASAVNGNITGSVAFVAGDVNGSLHGNVQGAVQGPVAAVTGGVGGSIAGSVLSVTNPVVVGTNNDKLGYTLTPTEHSNVSADVMNGMTSQGYTNSRAPNLDLMDVRVSTRLPTSSYSNPPNLSQITTSVWEEPTSAHRTPGTFGFNMDQTVSSRSIYNGGPVASVTNPVTVGQNNDKLGYAVSPTGLDTVALEPSVSLRQGMCIVFAAIGGTVAGAGTGGTGPITVAGGNNPSTTRITSRGDGRGNRTNVSLNLPA